MVSKIKTFGLALFITPLLALPTNSSAANINQEVAKAYNDGVVRCSNAECAKYLYACFRSYSNASLQAFMVCGTQASRLNENQTVVMAPNN